MQIAFQSEGPSVRVMSPAQLAAGSRSAVPMPEKESVNAGLGNFVDKRFTASRNHRQTYKHDERLLNAIRTYRGEYDPEKLRAIQQFSGSEVYARLTAMKCRSASALLRDIYLGTERPWSLSPTPDPILGEDVKGHIVQLVHSEAEYLRQNGQPVEPSLLQQRVKELAMAAEAAMKRKAAAAAARSADKLDDVLRQGGFYRALSEFLVDLPIFPFACIKGPVVRMHTSVKWQPNGAAAQVEQPRLFWERVSPFDLYFSPNASRIEDSYIIEHARFTRAELEDLRNVPGYRVDAIEDILERTRFGSVGLGKTWLSYFEYERAELENRDPHHRVSDTIDALEFHGYAPGHLLRDWGMSARQVPDEMREYFITAWMIDSVVIKAHLNPSPRQRPIYYVSSFEKMPGSIMGNGLVDILNDIQEVANASLRSLVNNMGMASGPQVSILDDRLAPGQESDQLSPWKRWHFLSDPMQSSGNVKPIEFFQPTSNANELLGIYKAMSDLADEVSALPRYLTGSQRTGGAAATASGLSMLMGNASKVLQQVAANVDEDVIQQVLEEAYAYAMVALPGTLTGDEEIVVRGVTTAVAREQDRVRQLEFLNITNNPQDMQILGMPGRAKVLSAVAKGLGLEDESIVPDEAKLEEMMRQQQQMAATQPTADNGAGPDGARSDGGTPRLDTVSNRGTS